jgi:hypothetical protein
MTSIKLQELVLLRRKMWEANQTGVSLRITADDVERLSGSPPSFKRRTYDLLGLIVSKAHPVTALVAVSTNISILAEAMIIVGIDPNELRFCIEYLAERGFVKAIERAPFLMYNSGQRHSYIAKPSCSRL